MTQSEYLSLADAAAELGATVETVKKAIQRGKLAVAFRGITISRDELERYKQARRPRGRPKKETPR